MNRIETIGDATLYLGDCWEILPRDKGIIDAVVTDPPYGIREAAGKNKTRGGLAAPKDYGISDWDNATVDYKVIQLLRRISQYQIIFGGNFYDLPPTPCWLIWDKVNGETDFADCEMAWTNLPLAVRKIEYLWNGMLRQNGEPRGDHPTQKPIGVMQWCLRWLPKTVSTICDPFMGSGTTGVACVSAGFKFIGIEREEKYFDSACRRIERAFAEPTLFKDEQPKPETLSLPLESK